KQTTYAKKNARATLRQVTAFCGDSGQDFRRLPGKRKLKVSREDADDSKWLAVECELLSDGVLIAREMVGPELVTKDYYVARVCLFFFNLKIATQHRVDLKG